MSMRDIVRDAVVKGDMNALEAVLKEEPRALRHIVGLMYGEDEAIRSNCAHALVIASKYHKKLVERVVKSLVWAMDQRSGTYAPKAPYVLKAIALENPELILPVLPDLVRLAGDTSLSQGICDTLRVVAEECPGELGGRLARELERRMEYGDFCDIIDRKK